ncbi:hypothetical protein M6B38_173505 [Iris pallida]|uniref:Uncharacterized protein n=1 Tax=Iris pallida TaxID=29817 RepID=A0AAX6ESQ5_IRIPA|nr:hypothetical protein M6B38_173505 [Iris pallida]
MLEARSDRALAFRWRTLSATDLGSTTVLRRDLLSPTTFSSPATFGEIFDF